MVPTITMPETKLFDENDFYNRHEKPSVHSVAGVLFSRQALSPCGLLRGGFFSCEHFKLWHRPDASTPEIQTNRKKIKRHKKKKNVYYLQWANTAMCNKFYLLFHIWDMTTFRKRIVNNIDKCISWNTALKRSFLINNAKHI